MICSSCGAEYEDEQLKCPFCNAENEVEAFIRHVDKVNNYKKEEARLWRLPGMARAKTGRILLLLLICFLLGILLASVIGIQVAKQRDKKEYEKNEKALSVLEQLYLEGDYDKIEAYINENRSYSSLLKKYNEVAIVNRSYRETKNIDSVIKDAIQMDYYEGNFSYCIGNLFGMLESCDYYLKDDYDYGNDEAMNYYKEQATLLLKNKFAFTDEEILKFLALKNEENGMKSAAELSYRRLTEK